MLSDQQRDIICTQNGYGPNDIASLHILRRNVEGGARVDQLRHTNYRLLGGVRGDINPTWSYDVYGMDAKVSLAAERTSTTSTPLASRTP